MPRVLLLVPTSTYRAGDFLDAARALRTEVVVASDHRSAMAARGLADGMVPIDCARPDRAAAAIVELAERTPIDAVVAVDDQGVVVAAMAAQRLGLRHNAPEAAGRSRDKAAMRRALAAAGIPQPDFRVANPEDDVQELARELGPPVVIKPVSMSGSRGVIRLDDPRAARPTTERIRSILAAAGEDRDGPLLVERYAPGTEIALEGILRAGALETLAIFDKPDPLEGPYFEETIYVTPSRLPDAALEHVRDGTGRAASALGLTEGPIHAELRVDGDEVRVLEVAARSIGGLCARSLRFGAGVSLEEVILRHALRMPPDDLAREPAASGVMMLPITRAGVLQEVRGLNEARAVPGVAGLEITIARGRPIVPLPEGDRYLGFLFARADTPDEVEAVLREAHTHIDVIVSPPT